MRDSLDFDALDDDEEAGGNKPPAYDPSPNTNNNKKPNAQNTNSNGNMTKSQTLHDAEDTDDEDDLPLPAPTPQRPAQIASVQRGAVTQQEKRSIDGDGEAMFSVGEDEEDADDVRGFSDSDEEGLVGKGRKGN